MVPHARKCLVLSVLFGVASAAGCVETGEELSADESALSGELESVGAQEPDVGCSGKRFTRPINELESGQGMLKGEPGSAGFAPYDLYFHPNNGLHGGWIEGWRLCNQGGQNYVICAGGYAPVRYWNPSSCNGSIHDYYPQGWHGWAQTGGGCG